jgi:hypothetical protein
MSDLGQGFGDQSDLLVPGNLDLFSRPRVQTPEGTATVRSMSFGTDKGEVLVPTVHPEGRIMSDEEAKQRYRDTGEHLGIFKTPEAATAYAQWLHGQQESLLPKTGGAPGWTAEDEARAQEQARTADVPPNVRDYMAHEEDRGEGDRGGSGIYRLFDEGEQPDRSKELHDQLWNRPDVHDRLIDARLNGHSWGDIQSHMAAHYDNGGTREQLGFAPAEGLMARLDGQHSQNMQVAMADDPVTGYGSMIPGVGGTGDIQRNAASMGGGFGPRASLGKYTQTPEGLHNYQINQGGQPTGFVEFTKQGNVARVENIAVEGRAGGLGAGETRAMARRFFSDHPEIDTIGGRHVSGSQAPHEITFSRQQLLGPGE